MAYSLPTSGPTAGPLVSIQVNADWRWILLDLVSMLENESMWEDGTDIEQARQYALELADLLVPDA